MRDLAANPEALAVIRAIDALASSLGMVVPDDGAGMPEPEDPAGQVIPAEAARALIRNHMGRLVRAGAAP